MNGFKDTNRRKDEYAESMRLFVSVKKKILHAMAQFEIKHHFHIRKKIARGLAFAMSILIFFSVLDASTLITLAAELNQSGAKVVSIDNPENITVMFGTNQDDIELPSLLNIVIEREREVEKTSDATEKEFEAKTSSEVTVSDSEEGLINASDIEVGLIKASDSETGLTYESDEKVETIEENIEVLYTGSDLAFGDIIPETIENPDTSENFAVPSNKETSTEQGFDENNDKLNSNNDNLTSDGKVLPDDNALNEEKSENLDETKNPEVSETADMTNNIDVSENADKTNNTDVSENADKTETFEESEIIGQDAENEEKTNGLDDNRETDEMTKDIPDIGSDIIAEIIENEISPETSTAIEKYYENVEIEVEWECKDYDPSMPGDYIFNAKLQDKFNGEKLDYSYVDIPAITVTVLPKKIELTADAGDVSVKLSADRGVFPDNVTLSVNIVEDAATINEVEGAVEGLRDEETNVTSSIVFDIKVLDEDGNEVEPDTTKGGVYVTFENKKIADVNLDTDIYHVHEGEAEELSVEENGETALVETDSFSYYVVEFTYDNLEYVLPGESKTKLEAILDYVGLTGEVTSAVSSNENLFKAYTEDNVWYVESLNAFTSEETLKVVINQTEYIIIVTDAAWDLQASVNPNSSYTPTQIVNGDFNEYPSMGYVIGGNTYKKSDLPNQIFTAGTIISSPIYNGVGEGWNTTEKRIGATGLLYDYCKIIGGSKYSPAYDPYSIVATYNDNLYWNSFDKNGSAFTASNPYSFIEMNYFARAVFWQDLPTQGGDVILWTLDHAARGQGSGYEAIHVEIGSPEYNNGQMVMPTGYDTEEKRTNIEDNSKAVYRYNGITNGSLNAGVSNGSELTNLRISQNDPKEWKGVKGFYIIPEGQNVTRFAFVSDEPGGADGNLLDNLTFSTMIGNVNAEQNSDGSVLVTGYWGETENRQLICVVGGRALRIDMSIIAASDNKNFKVLIPKDIVDGNLDMTVYHEDYSSAGKKVKIIPQNVAIPVQVQFDETPSFNTAEVKFRFEIKSVSGKDLNGNLYSDVPMPEMSTVEVACPAGTEVAGYNSSSTPWKFAIAKPGTYTYEISNVAVSGTNTVKPINEKTLIIHSSMDTEGNITNKYEVNSAVAKLTQDDFIATVGTAAASGGKGATFSVNNGVAQIEIGGTTPQASGDGFDSAAIKGQFPIDFTKDFVIKGQLAASPAPDGGAIGFVPDKTPQTSNQVQKFWLNAVFGGKIDNVTYNIPQNGNGIFLELDSWGSSQCDEDKVLSVNAGLNGRHINLFKTNANGWPVSSSVVTKTGYSNIAKEKWPSSLTDYTISFDASTKKLKFEIGDLYSLEWSNPVETFGQNTAYLIMGGNVRFAPTNNSAYGLSSTPTSTKMTFNDFYYSGDLSNSPTVIFGVSEYKETKITLNPGNGVTDAGTTEIKAPVNMTFENITIPTMAGKKFSGYYDENGKMYIDSTGKCVAAWDKHVATYTLTARYQSERTAVNVKISKDGNNVTSVQYEDGINVGLSADPEEKDLSEVKFYYALKGESGFVEWDLANPTILPCGTYEFYAVIGETSNYQSYTTGKTELTVTKADRTNSVYVDKAGAKVSEYTYKDAVNVSIDSEVKENASVYYFYHEVGNEADVHEWDISNPPTLEVGQYMIYGSVSETTNYKALITDKIQVTVNKIPGYYEEGEKPTAITGLIYSGNEEELINPGNAIDHGKLVYSFEKNGTFTEEIPKAIESGTYNIYYKVIGRKNYEDYSFENPIVIEIAKTNISDLDIPTTTGPLTENGNEQALVNAGSSTEGTLLYKLGEDGIYSTDIPTAKGEGTYKIFYKVVGDNNHIDTIEDYLETTINHKFVVAASGNKISAKCDLSECPKGAEDSFGTLTITANSKRYDGSLSQIATVTEDITIKLGGNVGSVYYRGVNGTVYDDSETVPVNVGTYEAYVKYTYEGNEYEAKIGFEITKSDSKIEVAPSTTGPLTENGLYQKLVNAGTSSGGSILYKLGEDGTYSMEIPTAKAEGTYRVYYKIEGDGNHNGTNEQYVETTINHKFVVAASGNKISAKCGQPECPMSEEESFGLLVITANNKVYDNSQKPIAFVAQDLTKKLGGTVGQVFYRGIDNTRYNDTTKVPTESGKYEAYVEFIYNNTSYFARKQFEITNADCELRKAPRAKEGIVESEKYQPLVTNGIATNGTILYKLGENGEYSTEVPLGRTAATYKVFYKVVGDKNYNGIDEQLVEVKIEHKPLDPNPEPNPDDDDKNGKNGNNGQNGNNGNNGQNGNNGNNGQNGNNGNNGNNNNTKPDNNEINPDDAKDQKEIEEDIKPDDNTKEDVDIPEDGKEEKTVEDDKTVDLPEGVIEIKIEDSALEKGVEVADETKMVESILNKAEKKQAENGEKITITIDTRDKEATKKEQKKLNKVLEKLETNGKVALVSETPFVVEMTKQVGDNKVQVIKKTDGSVGVTMEIPEELMIEGAEYYVVNESGEIIEARVEKTADGQAKMTFDTTDFKSIYSIVTVADENKIDENLARNLANKGYITGSEMRDTKNVTCTAHWFSLVLALIVAIMAFLSRRKQRLFYIIAAVGLVISVVIAIIGTCFIDWLAIGMMALLIAGVYLISLEKEEKAK